MTLPLQVLSLVAALSGAEALAPRPEVAPPSPRPALPSDVYALVFPLAGPAYFGDTFGERRTGHAHLGCDLIAPKLTPVLAVGGGLVDWIQDGRRGRCCGLGILHDDGYRSRYMHLNNDSPGTDDGQVVGIAPGLAIGSRVEAGQLIGWVGDSGNAEQTAPHLHLELLGRSGNFDPFPSLRAVRPEQAVLPGAPVLPGARVRSVRGGAADAPAQEPAGRETARRVRRHARPQAPSRDTASVGRAPRAG